MDFDRIPPHQVSLARQVQTVVRITFVEFTVVVGQRPQTLR